MLLGLFMYSIRSSTAIVAISYRILLYFLFSWLKNSGSSSIPLSILITSKSTTHILAPIVSNIEDLSIETKPIQIPIDFLTDVGLATCWDYAYERDVRPTMPIIIFYGSTV